MGREGSRNPRLFSGLLGVTPPLGSTRDVASFWLEYKNGGWPNAVLLLFGFFGLVLAIAAVVVAAVGSRAGRPLAAASAALAALILSIGAMGVMLGHRATDHALAGAGLSATQTERIEREGYSEAKSCAKFGLGCALIPFLGAALALLLSRRRGGEGLGVAAPAAILGVAALVAAGDVALVVQKLPGRDYSPYDPMWSFLEAKEEIDGGQTERGCRDLESTIGDRGPDGTVADPSRLPDFGRLAGICMDARIAEALTQGGLGDLLKTKPEMLDEAHKKRIEDEIAKRSPPSTGSSSANRRPPHVREHTPTIHGPLPPEVVQRIVRQNFGRFDLCYWNALRVDPTLSGEVRVRFVIDTTGAVTEVSDDHSLLTVADGATRVPRDSPVVDCIVRGFRNLSFPEPEGGKVVVTYPLQLSLPDPEAP
jgi:hypothetical protein